MKFAMPAIILLASLAATAQSASRPSTEKEIQLFADVVGSVDMTTATNSGFEHNVKAFESLSLNPTSYIQDGKTVIAPVTQVTALLINGTKCSITFSGAPDEDKSYHSNVYSGEEGSVVCSK